MPPGHIRQIQTKGDSTNVTENASKGHRQGKGEFRDLSQAERGQRKHPNYVKVRSGPEVSPHLGERERGKPIKNILGQCLK